MRSTFESYKKKNLYNYFVVLERHLEHINSRDPRRVWQYGCCSGRHGAEDYIGDINFGNDENSAEHGDRVYYFENEHDMLMFNLRWQ